MRSAVTATVVLILILLALAGILWWTGRGPVWRRPDFQADRAEITEKTQALDDAQQAVTRLSRQLQEARREADAEILRARTIGQTVQAQAREVIRLREQLRHIEAQPPMERPLTVADAAHALTALGY